MMMDPANLSLPIMLFGTKMSVAAGLISRVIGTETGFCWAKMLFTVPTGIWVQVIDGAFVLPPEHTQGE